MENLKNNKKTNEISNLHKSGNIRDLLKAGKSSNINLDISRLSCKGFSNLLEKAKKMKDMKRKDEKKNILEEKKEELNLIIKEGKENIKKNNISLTKIPEDFEILKKFSLKMSNMKTNFNLNHLLNNTDIQKCQKEENKEINNRINTTANTNSNTNTNSNFNLEKTKTKESIDKGNNESKNEKEEDKENEESSTDYIRKTVTNNPNMEKRKYFHFYSIFNNLSNKNKNKINLKTKFNQKKISIVSPDSLFQNSENNDGIEEEENKNDIHNSNNGSNKEDKLNDDNNNDNIFDNNQYNKFNNENNNQNNNNNIKEFSNIYQYHPGPSCTSTEDILHDLENINVSFDKNNNSKIDENSEDNSFDLKIYEKRGKKNNFEEMNSFNENDINENNYNKEENECHMLEETDEKILNFEEEDNINDFESRAMEYETVNSNYSIKQCGTVLEYSFREEQNISYCSLMEDKSKSIENFNNNKNQMVFQLFDGYKGEEVSYFLQQNFTQIYKQYLDETKGNIPRSLVKSFKEIDEIIKKLPNIEGKSSTGTVIHIIWESKKKLIIYSGNVGNSRACLVSPVYVIKLTQEHITPEIKNKNYRRYKKNNLLKQIEENEKKNKIFGKYKLDDDIEKEIEEKYGHKKYRLKYKKENIINKNEKSEEKLVDCVPYIAKMEIDLSIKNQFLFLASDGIWDKIDEIEMQQIIENTQDTEQLCSIFIKNSLQRDTKDNISIFSIKLT